MNIYLIRHGRQLSRRCNVDVGLAPEGVRQAELLRDRFSNVPIDAVYSSDLQRAVQTAELINSKKLPHQICAGLREIDFGELTGNSDDYNLIHYEEYLKDRMQMKEDICFPGGECGRDVLQRAMPVLLLMAESGKKEIAAVTHGGTIRSIIAGILGLPQEKRFLIGKELENCSITKITYHEKEQQFTLERLNDYAHLEPFPELLRNKWS